MLKTAGRRTLNLTCLSVGLSRAILMGATRLADHTHVGQL